MAKEEESKRELQAVQNDLMRAEVNMLCIRGKLGNKNVIRHSSNCYLILRGGDERMRSYRVCEHTAARKLVGHTQSVIELSHV